VKKGVEEVLSAEDGDHHQARRAGEQQKQGRKRDRKVRYAQETDSDVEEEDGDGMYSQSVEEEEGATSSGSTGDVHEGMHGFGQSSSEDEDEEDDLVPGARLVQFHCVLFFLSKKVLHGLLFAACNNTKQDNVDPLFVQKMIKRV
jgi:hypothetical protein